MEACTLELYTKNIFRVTGLPVDASSKEIARQAQKLQMLEEMAGNAERPSTAFGLAVAPTSDEIRAALSRMKESQHRIVDEFFWYWPEDFGSSKNDSAIQAMVNGDTEGAVKQWRSREKAGSLIAKHNMAVMYHMYAVDWSLYHVSYDLDPAVEGEIKAYWKKAFERWEVLVEADEIRNVLKQRIRSLDDEALTTGFVRRFFTQLPQAFDHINAEAALKLAERNRMDWARFHVKFMRETNQGQDDVERTAEMVLAPTKARVEQHLATFEVQAEREPGRGAELAKQLLARCRPMMNLFDLFHGKEAHQRNDLFDRVAETVLHMIIGHQRATDDNNTFSILLNDILPFASSSRLRERIIENISIAEGNLKGEVVAPLFKQLSAVQDSESTPKEKLASIAQNVISGLPDVISKLANQKELSDQLLNSVAIVLREISIQAYNDFKDYMTAESAIQLAQKFVVDRELERRINEDIDTLANNKKHSLCFYCGTAQGTANSSYQLPMYGDVTRRYRTTNYRKINVPIQRCEACKSKHDTAGNWGCFTVIALGAIGLIGGPIGVIIGLLIGWMITIAIKSNGPHNNIDAHPDVREMRSRGWRIGERP